MTVDRGIARTARVCALAALTMGTHLTGAWAQQSTAYPTTPGYPASPGYPGAPAGYPTTAYPQQYPGLDPGFTTAPPPTGRFRDIFAGTLALVLQQAGTMASARIAQGVTGSIANWFSRAPRAQAAAYPGYAPGATYTPPQTGYQTQGYTTPTPPAAGSYSNAPYSSDATYSNNGGYTSTGAPTSYDPSGQANGAYDTSAGTAGGLYAGMAYEVHLLSPDGRDTAVDPASYTFSTGDRFYVYYRPSLPGTVDIYNTNPLGRTTRIDSTSIAAGQLVTLGPYQFTDNKGDETLQLLLSPCTNSGLLTATRDIVKVGADSPVAAGVQLPGCGAATRGMKPKTREIKKVGVDGGTSYALDQVSQQELASGRYDSRSVTISFHHQ